MAKVNVTTETIRTIQLTDKESDYLAILLRNYTGTGAESALQTSIRENLYHCVTRTIPGEVEYK